MSTPEVRWLSGAQQEAWREFVSACHAFFAAVDAQLQRDSGMPLAYYEILVRLSEAPERSLRMSQLADAVGASKSRTSHAVTRLEERGWVRRTDCPTDRRGQIAQLTGEGLRVLTAAAPGHVAQVRRALFDALAPGQVTQLHVISAAMRAAARESHGGGTEWADTGRGEAGLAHGDAESDAEVTD